MVKGLAALDKLEYQNPMMDADLTLLVRGSLVTFDTLMRTLNFRVTVDLLSGDPYLIIIPPKSREEIKIKITKKLASLLLAEMGSPDQ